MTVAKCLSVCRKKDYWFAGIAQNNACYCDTELRPSAQHCGGDNRLDVYELPRECKTNSEGLCPDKPSIRCYGLVNCGGFECQKWDETDVTLPDRNWNAGPYGGTFQIDIDLERAVESSKSLSIALTSVTDKTSTMFSMLTHPNLTQSWKGKKLPFSLSQGRRFPLTSEPVGDLPRLRLFWKSRTTKMFTYVQLGSACYDCPERGLGGTSSWQALSAKIGPSEASGLDIGVEVLCNFQEKLAPGVLPQNSSESNEVLLDNMMKIPLA